MSFAIPEWLAPWLVGAGLAGIVLALIAAIRAFMQVRRAEYYVVREEARRTALRAVTIAAIFALGTISFLIIPRQASTPQPTPTATPHRTPTPTPTRARLTPTVTTTSTPQATATEPFIPTSTPQATLPVAFTSPLPSSVPPPADARFEFWTMAQGVDDNNLPVDPAEQFPAGIQRIYLFFRYDGLLSKAQWSTAWYWNGELIGGGTKLWQPEKPAGARHEFLEFAGGYRVGEYEVQVWLGDRLQIQAGFSVVGTEG
jgi:hypothetical protein